MGRIFLIFLVLVASGLMVANAEPPQQQDPTIIVYYFHRTARCSSCILLEKLTREAVNFGFEQELANGRITIEAINVDEKDNEHFVDDYNLNFQLIVLSEIENGKEKRWKNLEKVWTLLGDQGQLIKYIQNEIKNYLNEAKL